MTKLNKTFQQNQVLTAAELNALTTKIDEIITVVSSLSGGSGVTDSQVQDKINEAKEELNNLLDLAIQQLQDNIDDLREAQEGASEVITAEEWELYRKKITDTEEEVAAIKLSFDGIDLVALKQTVDDINTWAGSITVDPGKIEILAALLDENDQLILNPASIIAAIVDDGTGKLTSEIAISADQVMIDGNVTLTEGLTAMNADITNLSSSKASIDDLQALSATVQNLNVPTKAEIKEAVIDDLTTGDLTITGTLHYNKAIGNILDVSSTSQLSDDTYFAQFTGASTADSSNYPVITLPANNLVQGQTLFINIGTRCLKIKSNKTINCFIKHSNGIDDQYDILLVDYAAEQAINVFEAGWNGIVEFIYTGTKWQQLIHNINV